MPMPKSSTRGRKRWRTAWSILSLTPLDLSVFGEEGSKRVKGGWGAKQKQKNTLEICTRRGSTKIFDTNKCKTYTAGLLIISVLFLFFVRLWRAYFIFCLKSELVVLCGRARNAVFLYPFFFYCSRDSKASRWRTWLDPSLIRLFHPRCALFLHSESPYAPAKFIRTLTDLPNHIIDVSKKSKVFTVTNIQSTSERYHATRRTCIHTVYCIISGIAILFALLVLDSKVGTAGPLVTVSNSTGPVSSWQFKEAWQTGKNHYRNRYDCCCNGVTHFS